MTEQDGWIPETATILQASTPTSGPETKTHVVVTYVLGWIFLDDFTWDFAIREGIGAEEAEIFNRWAPSTVLKVAVTEKCNAHLDYFGIYTGGREEALNQSCVRPGVHYLITPNSEFGVRVGWGESVGDLAATRPTSFPTSASVSDSRNWTLHSGSVNGTDRLLPVWGKRFRGRAEACLISQRWSPSE